MKVNFSITLPERTTRYVLMGGGFVVGLLGFMAAAWAGVPNIFKDGDVLTAQALNDNFAAVGDPPGTIVAYAGDVKHVPIGWLPCDGAAESVADYPALFNAIGGSWGSTDAGHFNVPDLRGRFLRGVSGITTTDPECSVRTASAAGGLSGCNVGTLQVDQITSHTHATQILNYGTTNTGTPPMNVLLSNTQNGGLTALTTTAAGGAETRPKNAAVYFIIKI